MQKVEKSREKSPKNRQKTAIDRQRSQKFALGRPSQVSNQEGRDDSLGSGPQNFECVEHESQYIGHVVYNEPPSEKRCGINEFYVIKWFSPRILLPRTVHTSKDHM